MAAKKTKKPVKKARAAAEASTSAKPENRRKKRDSSRHTGEIVAICAIAAGILLGIGIYAGGGGLAGQVVNGVFTGLFGFGALLLPAAAVGLGVLMILNRFEPPGVRDTVLSVSLFLCVISLAHVLKRGAEVVHEGFPAYLAYVFKNGTSVNGGVFGAMLGDLLLKALGTAGTYIAIIALAMVLIILLTDKSIVQGVITGVNKAKSLRPQRTEDEAVESIPQPEHVRALRDPRKATVTIGERADVERPKILIFNEAEERYVSRKPVKEPESECLAEPEVAHVHDSIGQSEPGLDAGFDSVFETELIPADDDAIPGITTLTRREEEPADDITEPPFDDYGYIGEPEVPQYSDMERLKAQLTGAKADGKADERAAHTSIQPTPEPLPYKFPPVELLNRNTSNTGSRGRAQILENSRKLEDTLKSFGVEARVIEVSKGPAVTRYELSPGQGVKVSKIAGLADDLALNLAAVGIRIEAPIPGKAAVGIEIPNKEVTTVFLREVIEDEQFTNYPSRLAFALGKDIAGKTVVADIARMPHLLIAGATGSGKSVCVNTLITSILYKADPNDVKLVMIDPKVVELSVYNGIPHLLIPVVTDAKKAAGALNWAVMEMVNRYNLFAETGVRDLRGYNLMLTERGEAALPQIVIIIDELADLMMVAPGEVEDAICRLAQMARAAGLHLIIATQRPSVDVITGLIKANIPSRLAFAVSSGVDSRTILDSVGAEKLLGKGDMLFYPAGVSKPQRVQGAFISDKEVESIVAFVKNNSTGIYDQEMINKITSAKTGGEASGEVDELFVAAAEFIIEKDKASASMLQRQFRIGYNKAARIIEELEARGVVGPEDGSKPRKVLMNSYQWTEYKQTL